MNNSVELREDGQIIEERGDQERIEGRKGAAGEENEVEGGEERRERGRRRRRREASLGNGLGEREKDATLQDIRCCAESGNTMPHICHFLYATAFFGL